MTNGKLSAFRAAMAASGVDEQTRSEVIDRVRSAVPDNWIYRIVVIAIGLAVFVPLAGLAAGGSTDDKVKLAQLLLPIATTALGALAGLLAPSPAGDG